MIKFLFNIPWRLYPAGITSIRDQVLLLKNKRYYIEYRDQMLKIKNMYTKVPIFVDARAPPPLQLLEKG